MAKRLRCYLGLHRYQRRRTDDGKKYEECRYCGKYRDTLLDFEIPTGAM